MKQVNLNSKVSITKSLLKSLFNFQGPARDIRGYSSAGRAPALQAGGQRFDPAYLHQRFKRNCKTSDEPQFGLIAQVVRAHA